MPDFSPILGLRSPDQLSLPKSFRRFMGDYLSGGESRFNQLNQVGADITQGMLPGVELDTAS